jgi:hypothetical protein
MMTILLWVMEKGKVMNQREELGDNEMKPIVLLSIKVMS